jgi:glutathione S-transferase
MEMITLYGAHISPYVRKTRLALALKGVVYEHIPVIPIGGNQPLEFKANSPLGKIPLLRVGDAYIPDSTVICAWLERALPQPPLLPADNLLAAKALWYEEYADSHMTAVIGGHLFAEVVLAPMVFKREPIQSDIDAALNVEIPAICTYLDSELKGDYLVGDHITIADIAVAGLFVTMQHCDQYCDASRWPKLAAYVERMHNSELFVPIIAEEKQFLASLAS